MPSLRQSLITLGLAMPIALACVGKNAMPKANKTISNDRPIEVAAGEVFDGKGARYDRGTGSCNSQKEGGKADTVFILREGATLRNVIIGPKQQEGVRCLGGDCTIENVWFEGVCEDAITVKDDVAGKITNIIGGGAFHAVDKVIQHNGCGTVNITNFYARDYGKLYRACGTCAPCKRDVRLQGVSAYGGEEVVGINLKTGDTAKLVNVCTDAKRLCELYDKSGAKAGEC